MVASLAGLAELLRPGVGRLFNPRPDTPEETATKADLARRAAAESARYAAMTPEQRAAYDDETFGMCPRLPGAAEHWARRRP
jgi:hypothetical protein